MRRVCSEPRVITAGPCEEVFLWRALGGGGSQQLYRRPPNIELLLHIELIDASN